MASRKKTSKNIIIKKNNRTRKNVIDFPTHEVTEDISFGMLQEEIDDIIDGHRDYNINKPIRLGLQKQINELMPKKELKTATIELDNHRVKINNIRERHLHSPYVLNLKQLTKEKKERELKKQFLRERMNQKQEKFTQIKEKVKLFPKKQSQTVCITKKFKSLPQFTQVFKQKQKTDKPLANQRKEIKNQFTKKPIFSLPHAWYKPVLVFATICLLVILPIKGLSYVKAVLDSKNEILDISHQAYQDLKIAARSVAEQDTQGAQAKFEAAKLNFSQANQQIQEMQGIMASIISLIPQGEKYIKDATSLTRAGVQIAGLGEKITKSFEVFDGQKEKTLTEKIQFLKNELTVLMPDIDNLSDTLEPINPDILPEEQQVDFIKAKKSLQKIQVSVKELIDFSDNLNDMLGHKYKRRYLFIFQNNNELRATGGFMGSLALVDIHNGEIEQITIPGGGTYDFQGSQKKMVSAPYPLQLINSRWELQDTNWFFDFPASAKQIQAFFEAAGGPSVDGVITINASLIEKFLTHTANIKMDGYDKTISATNFIEETQKAVELEYDKEENKPKQFIADLAPKLLEQMFNPEKTDILGLANEARLGFEQKEIQVFFNNQRLQEIAKQYNWAGEVKATSKNYLAVVNTNIAGGKTDGVIKQDINHVSEIQADGTVIDTVTVIRTHQGDLNNFFTRNKNVNYLRVYVPKGSQLLSTEGFEQPPLELFRIPEDYFETDIFLTDTEQKKHVDESTNTMIYNAFDKTVFGNWTQTEPQGQTSITIRYKLPYKIEVPKLSWLQKILNKGENSIFYSVFYQKQSGATNTKLTSEIILPDYLNINWYYPKGAEKNPSRIKNEVNFDSDTLTGVIIKPN